MTAADGARERLAAGLRLPRRRHAVLAAAIAIQIGTAAYGISEQTAAGMGILLGGLGVLLALAFTVHRFRRLNGVRVDVLTSQIVLGTRTVSSLVYLGSLAAATWAAFDATWWLVAVLAVIGCVGLAALVVLG